jgi:acetyl/propionyl-CoA carboxylase alpha subunit
MAIKAQVAPKKTPAPAITDEQRNQLYAAVFGKAVNYQSAGKFR